MRVSYEDMGRLVLVGMGPGDLGGLTLRAREALEKAQAVIGYSTYIKLLEEMGLLEGRGRRWCAKG